MKQRNVPTIPPKYLIKSFIARASNESGKSKRQLMQELADEMGVSLSHIYRLSRYPLNSEKSITTDQLMAGAKFFGCTPEDLLHPVYKDKAPRNAGTRKTTQEEA